MSDDVKEWLGQCTVCIKRKSPAGYRWDRIAMDILNICNPTPTKYHYILVIADYFSKWTEAFPIKNKCAYKVADSLDREFENGLMKSLYALLGCTKTRTAPYRPESNGMIERFNRTCLMMLSMFVNVRRDNCAYIPSVHRSTGYSPFRLMMGEECSLPQDVSTSELRTNREHDTLPQPFAT